MRLKFVAASVLAAGLILPALAEEQKPLTPAAIEQIQLAGTLARYGGARKDPILLLAAAKIAKGISPEGAPSAEKLPTMDELLASAEEYAEGDELVLGVIGDIKAEQSKGYCYGSYGTGWC
jgi:hypothetical protein